ncbi:polyketide biosynthesis methyltransferase [Microbacterium protaetiae]|uniref:Polyketide biosynthesis methyltransferase n=1 Tax=Microbacterium protaetiae TaxID=2509458 RepID=A0A4P6EM19_9MICO|nr:methyltransferase dimerization domain-containing protein [Microbacterium protaetiae]QAY58878.1 polyketide biosynthesis methyltransferase [Microbacterium protaetiae]
MTADPTRILDIATGYMASKQLFNAARIGLFRAIAEGAHSPAEVAAATEHPERQVRILLDGAAAAGLLNRADGHYVLADDAAEYLTGGERDLSAFLNFLEKGSFEAFGHYRHTVDADEGGTLDFDEAGWGMFMAGVMQYNGLHAHWFGEKFPTSGPISVLDFGGFTAGWSIELAKRNPELTSRMVYPAESGPMLTPEIEAAGLSDRIAVEAGETATAVPGGAHDLILAVHVIHRFTDEQNRRILKNLRASAKADAKLALFDFFLDSLPTQRELDARHAAEYFNFDGTIVWPEETVASWLEDAGWRFNEYVDVPGSPRVLVATAA